MKLQIIYGNQPCNCEQPGHPGGDTHACLAPTGVHANGVYLIMLHLRSNIQQECLNHLPCSVEGGGVGVVAPAVLGSGA